MTKLAGNVNLPTEMKISLAIPAGVQIARLASSRIIRVEISSGRPSYFQTDSGIKLMLAPKSARAFYLSSLKPHGMRNFPGSPIKDDVFDHDQVLKPLFPSHIPIEDSDSLLEKSDTSLSLPEYETFIDHTEETNSGSTNTHADYSLPKYDS
nr:hypothetical protein [Tanacetum cinerariifolium]